MGDSRWNRALGHPASVPGLVHGDPHAGNVYATGSHNYARLASSTRALHVRGRRSPRLLRRRSGRRARPFVPRCAACRTRFAYRPLGGRSSTTPRPCLLSRRCQRRRSAPQPGAAPARVSLDDVWQALEAELERLDAIGLLHPSYVRSVFDDRSAERRRVKILVRCATIAGQEAWWPVADRSGSMLAFRAASLPRASVIPRAVGNATARRAPRAPPSRDARRDSSWWGDGRWQPRLETSAIT